MLLTHSMCLGTSRGASLRWAPCPPRSHLVLSLGQWLRRHLLGAAHTKSGARTIPYSFKSTHVLCSCRRARAWKGSG